MILTHEEMWEVYAEQCDMALEAFERGDVEEANRCIEEARNTKELLEGRTGRTGMVRRPARPQQT